MSWKYRWSLFNFGTCDKPIIVPLPMAECVRCGAVYPESASNDWKATACLACVLTGREK